MSNMYKSNFNDLEGSSGGCTELPITVSPNNTYVAINEAHLYQITPNDYLFSFNGTLKPSSVPQNTDLLTFNYNNTTGSCPASANFCANATPYKAVLNTYYQNFVITLKETYNSGEYTNRKMSGSVIFTIV